MKEKTLNITSVHQCNNCLGHTTLHPLVSVIDLSKTNIEQYAIKFNFYTIIMIECENEKSLYGCKSYDYSNASMIFLTPGESLKIDKRNIFPRNGWLLAFHQDLLCGTSLEKNISQYTFFKYYLNETLHLSLREKAKITDWLHHIKEELEHAMDSHSKTILSRHIELLLDYSSRFYERQFITRNKVNKLLIKQLDLHLSKYIQSGQLKNRVFPSAVFCAKQLHLSIQYFSDLLKFETGKTIYEYFQQKRLSTSCQMLLDEKYTVAMIAEELGYPSTQNFSSLFKKLKGLAPAEYKKIN